MNIDRFLFHFKMISQAINEIILNKELKKSVIFVGMKQTFSLYNF